MMTLMMICGLSSLVSLVAFNFVAQRVVGFDFTGCNEVTSAI